MKNILNGQIQVVESAENWEKAIETAAQPLIKNGKIKYGYVENIIKNIKELGPYIILLPGVAMPHARPDENVIESSLSLLKINKGVSFSEDTEDVKLMFVLAAKDSNSHIDIIEQLTELLGDDEKIERLMNAETVEEVENLI
ncbi:MAG: PTS sugar transporter subunit IIA [Fusobacterium sp.]|uniref:PTS sugar transporter subunit IIA n=1 Tax=Fusobacterium sp. SB021 TaxID=2744227 RepID=UPI003A324DEF